MSDELLFLGTGGSMGVPVIGCHCRVCRSTNSKDRRCRPLALLTLGGKKIMIDAGTDLRQQALAYGITHLDGMILTHTHQDHVGGLDDLRPLFFERKSPLPCLLLKSSFEDLKRRFYYIFALQSITQLPRLDLYALGDLFGTCNFLGETVEYFTYEQVGMEVMGIRIGSFAYVTDIPSLDEQVISRLMGVETLVISALRPSPSPMHLSIDEAIAFARRCQAKRTYFTHIAHDIDHDIVEKDLPPNIHLAYDGLRIPL